MNSKDLGSATVSILVGDLEVGFAARRGPCALSTAEIELPGTTRHHEKIYTVHQNYIYHSGIESMAERPVVHSFPDSW